MKKWLSVWLCIALLMFMVAPFAQAEETVSFTDSAGRTVEIPKEITRIAPSGSLAQIFLFALAPEAFVGLASAWTSDAEEFLGDYYAMPVLGHLYGAQDLNLEEIMAHDPQVIIDVGEAKSTIVEDMDDLQEQLGIPTIHIDASLATYAEAYRTLGEVLGVSERGEALAAYCEETLARAEALMEKIGDDKKELLYCLGDNGLNVISRGSFHGEVIDLVANNVAVVENFSGKGSGDPVDMEQLMLWNPEYIIFAPESAYADVGDDPLWQELRAIQSGNYAQSPDAPYSWLGSPPATQRLLGLLWLCEMLYPEDCGYSLQEEVTRYYELFYHAELTQEQYDRLMQGAKVQAQ